MCYSSAPAHVTHALIAGAAGGGDPASLASFAVEHGAVEALVAVWAAVGEAVILLHPPLPLVGVSIWMSTWPSARLSFCWHPLSVSIESRMAETAHLRLPS